MVKVDRNQLALKGSSLIEVLVSLIIIMVCIGLALGIYIQVIALSPLRSLRLAKEMERIGTIAIQNKDFETRYLTLSDGTLVQQKIEVYGISPLFIVYELKPDMEDQGRLNSFRKIIFNPYYTSYE